MITTAEQRQYFEENGYILIPDMFHRQEIEAVLSDEARLDTQRRVVESAGMSRNGMVVEDSATPRLQFDIHKTDSRFALMCRHPRLAGLMQELMGRPLYLYHSKLAFKAPFTGSVQFWHQDYGYWQPHHPEPAMGSCLVTLDEHTEDNACMQLLAGSHREGVVPHEPAPRESTGDGQIRIPAANMRDYCRRYPRIKLIGKPGTLVAWHSNTMHASSHNLSENPRRALIVAFNAIGNNTNLVSAENAFHSERDLAIALTADDCLVR